MSLLYWKNLKSKYSLKFEKTFFFEHHVSIQKFSDFREFQVLDFFSLEMPYMQLIIAFAFLPLSVPLHMAFHMLAGTLLWSHTPQPKSVLCANVCLKPQKGPKGV